MHTCRPTSEGFGQQCCYKSDGNLITGEFAGGSVDIMSPNIDYNRHISDDVVPYVICCQAATKCNEYYQWRPSGTERGYALPVPGKHYIHRHTVTVQLLQTYKTNVEYIHAHSCIPADIN